jgi:hypothetical protein
LSRILGKAAALAVILSPAAMVAAGHLFHLVSYS